MSGTMRTALIELMLTMWPELRLTMSGRRLRVTRIRPDQIGLDDRGPIVRRAGIEARPAADVVTGIVDEDVDRLEGVGNEIGQAVHGLGVGNIELDRESVVAHFRGELTKGGRIAVGEHDPSSTFDQRLRDRTTHTAGGAGYHGISARCFSHCRSPQWDGR